MKVSNKAQSNLASLVQKKEVPFKKATTNLGRSQNANLPKSSAEVHLSPRAKNMKAAQEILKKDAVDEAKISHFQNLIDSGKYKIDAGRVADKLINEHLKMPS